MKKEIKYPIQVLESFKSGKHVKTEYFDADGKKLKSKPKPEKKKETVKAENKSDLMDLNETCKMLNLKVSRIRFLVFQNKIPVIRIGKLLRFSREDILKWIETKKYYSND